MRSNEPDVTSSHHIPLLKSSLWKRMKPTQRNEATMVQEQSGPQRLGSEHKISYGSYKPTIKRLRNFRFSNALLKTRKNTVAEHGEDSPERRFLLNMVSCFTSEDSTSKNLTMLIDLTDQLLYENADIFSFQELKMLMLSFAGSQITDSERLAEDLNGNFRNVFQSCLTMFQNNQRESSTRIFKAVLINILSTKRQQTKRDMQMLCLLTLPETNFLFSRLGVPKSPNKVASVTQRQQNLIKKLSSTSSVRVFPGGVVQNCDDLSAGVYFFQSPVSIHNKNDHSLVCDLRHNEVVFCGWKDFGEGCILIFSASPNSPEVFSPETPQRSVNEIYRLLNEINLQAYFDQVENDQTRPITGIKISTDLYLSILRADRMYLSARQGCSNATVFKASAIIDTFGTSEKYKSLTSSIVTVTEHSQKNRKLHVSTTLENDHAVLRKYLLHQILAAALNQDESLLHDILFRREFDYFYFMSPGPILKRWASGELPYDGDYTKIFKKKVYCIVRTPFKDFNGCSLLHICCIKNMPKILKMFLMLVEDFSVEARLYLMRSTSTLPFLSFAAVHSPQCLSVLVEELKRDEIGRKILVTCLQEKDKFGNTGAYYLLENGHRQILYNLQEILPPTFFDQMASPKNCFGLLAAGL